MKKITCLFVLLFPLFIFAQDCHLGENLFNPSSKDPWCIREYNGNVYGGGWYYLERFINGSWNEFGGGPIFGGSNGLVRDMIIYEDALIIAGNFYGVGDNIVVNNICS